jgi:hypothetical protein
VGGKVKTPMDASSIQLTADRSNVHSPARRTQESATDVSEIGLVIELLLYSDVREAKVII